MRWSKTIRRWGSIEVLTTFTALFDANVLYPATLRSLLMYLSLAELFRARWTEQIHDEWIRSLMRDRPEIPPERLAETRQLMDAHVKGALISGYEDLMAGLDLPDPNDRHVLAAAIHGRVDVIVTYDLSGFPATALSPYRLEAQHPDIFLTHLLDLAPQAVITAVRHHRSRLTKPSLSAEDYLGSLERLQLPITARHLRGYLNIL